MQWPGIDILIYLTFLSVFVAAAMTQGRSNTYHQAPNIIMLFGRAIEPVTCVGSCQAEYMLQAMDRPRQSLSWSGRFDRPVRGFLSTVQGFFGQHPRQNPGRASLELRCIWHAWCGEQEEVDRSAGKVGMITRWPLARMGVLDLAGIVPPHVVQSECETHL